MPTSDDKDTDTSHVELRAQEEACGCPPALQDEQSRIIIHTKDSEDRGPTSVIT